MVWGKETVPLAKALQRCAVHLRKPPGALCRVVRELHECLTSVVQSGNMLDLEMMDVAEKDHVAPTSEGRAPSPMPRAEPLVNAIASSELSASEPG